MKSRSSVALNCRFSGAERPTGAQRAAFALFDAIVRLPERECPLVVFADPKFPGIAGWADVHGVTLVPVPFSEWSRGKAQFWEQFALPRLCRKMNCGVAHHPVTTCPFLTRRLKNIVTLHDLNFLKHPAWYSRALRAVYSFTALPGLLRAWRVVAVSDYIRSDASQRLGIEQERLRRVYNGVRFVPHADPFAHSNVPYILCAGSLQPHKNLARLILAFRELRERQPELELWIAGRPRDGFPEMRELEELLETPGLQMLGYLSDEELQAAYANALVFCYPSLEEGFGVPMLEAMVCGTLVVASNASCLPEIAGGHAELVDPLSPPSIATGIQALLDLTPAERDARVRAARCWAEEFTWQSAARQYLCIYEEGR